MNDNAEGPPVAGLRPEDAEYDPPLVALPGADVSAEVLLHRTLNKIHRIKNVVVIIQWDDDTVVTDWSTMKCSELCMAGKVLDMHIEDEIRVPT